jgi:hypothetical protein
MQNKILDLDSKLITLMSFVVATRKGFKGCLKKQDKPQMEAQEQFEFTGQMPKFSDRIAGVPPN